MDLSPSELERYSRQMLISGWGEEGQKRLKAAKVAVAGVGGLGCPASLYLTAAGIGQLVIIDKDQFELNNLNRQILGWQSDIGRYKSESAKEKLNKLNSEVEVKAVVAEIKEENVQDLMADVDIVVDGQDNWETRFIINRYCVTRDLPFVHAGVSELHGQVTTILPHKGPCLRCLFPHDPPETEKVPVAGVTPALFASLQVMETIKIITGLGKPLTGRMLFGNGETMEFETAEVTRNSDCQVCSDSPKT
ncbi:MAG: HesA/MoeB/ThiF family protein [Thermoproteota archaeon]